MAREWSRRSIEEIARKIGKGLGGNGNTKFYTVAHSGSNSNYDQKSIGMIDTAPVGGRGVYRKYVLPMLYPTPATASDWSICDDIVLNQRKNGIMLYAFPNSIYENSQNRNKMLQPIASCLSGNLGDFANLAKDTTKCDYSVELYNKRIFTFKNAELMDKILNKELESNLIQRWDINDKLFMTDPQSEEHYIDVIIEDTTFTPIGRDYPNSSVATTYFLAGLDYFHSDYLYYYPIHYDSNDEYDYRPEFIRFSAYGATVFRGTMVRGDFYTAWKTNFVIDDEANSCFMYLVSREKG